MLREGKRNLGDHGAGGFAGVALAAGTRRFPSECIWMIAFVSISILVLDAVSCQCLNWIPPLPARRVVRDVEPRAVGVLDSAFYVRVESQAGDVLRMVWRIPACAHR